MVLVNYTLSGPVFLNIHLHV
jgi:hypothetical protein